MSNFKFLHAADLHLDSPLEGLRQRSSDMSVRLKDASKQAFDNLISLAIDESCRFVVLAGDIFDGQLRHFPSGLHFVRRLSKLKEAGIDVFIVFGNHDAENKFAAHLPFAEGVHVFSKRAPQTIELEDVGAAIHGQSFPRRDVTENLAVGYPPAIAGAFNVGVLHTACAGREGPHASYAPCTVEQLINQGYDYWALGHVHQRQVLSTEPWVVYPGNLQGRNARETGPKGATLVEVVDGRVRSAEHRTLDAVRWEVIEIDVQAARTRSEVLGKVQASVDSAALPADRLTALRIRLIGSTRAHGELIAQRSDVTDEVEKLLAAAIGEVWLEKLEIQTQASVKPTAADASIGGKLAIAIAELQSSPWYREQLQKRLNEIRSKVPASARPDELFAALDAEGADRAANLALSMIEAAPEASDEAA